MKIRNCRLGWIRGAHAGFCAWLMYRRLARQGDALAKRILSEFGLFSFLRAEISVSEKPA